MGIVCEELPAPWDSCIPRVHEVCVSFACFVCKIAAASFPRAGAGFNSTAEVSVERSFEAVLKNRCIGSSFGCMI